MHITLHLTTGCNMNCNYCYSPPEERHDMSPDVLLQTIEYIKSLQQPDTGVIFFGGEPLMCKDLIYTAVGRLRNDERINTYSYHFKVSTNGILLDKVFLKFAKKEKVQVAISIDGIRQAHDYHRRTKNGDGTFTKIESKIELLLSFQPYAYALMVVTPETVCHYADSFQFLIEKGFRYIIASLDYSGDWDKKAMKQLKKEYTKLADLYESYTMKEKKFYFSPFEKKFASHIQGSDSFYQQCHLGIKQISIAPDGTIYPCVQFVGDGISNTNFAIGNVWDGINQDKQQQLYRLSREENEFCQTCDVNYRCEHRCSCLNRQTTGSINCVSPILCESEQMLIPIVDKLGETLFKKRAPLFIQKHYNAVYPLISCLEDSVIKGEVRLK